MRNWPAKMFLGMTLLPAGLQSQIAGETAERATAVTAAHSSEQNPTSSTAPDERRAAVQYFTNDHSLHVTLCYKIFSALPQEKQGIGHEVMLQYMASTGAFLVEHPDESKSAAAQNLAGIEAALGVYTALLSTESRIHFRYLDDLVKKRVSGQLADFVHANCVN